MWLEKAKSLMDGGDWHLDQVIVTDLINGKAYSFLCRSWFHDGMQTKQWSRKGEEKGEPQVRVGLFGLWIECRVWWLRHVATGKIQKYAAPKIMLQ